MFGDFFDVVSVSVLLPLLWYHNYIKTFPAWLP